MVQDLGMNKYIKDNMREYARFQEDRRLAMLNDTSDNRKSLMQEYEAEPAGNVSLFPGQLFQGKHLPK